LIRPTNREDLIKVVEKNWGIGKYKNIKLFTMDGIEYFDEDLLYLRDGDRLYVSKGTLFFY
jgi:transcription-repair coupling factor (superfamily II helicase)